MPFRPHPRGEHCGDDADLLSVAVCYEALHQLQPVDAIDHGTLVFRNAQRQIILPSSRLFHWAKRFFEGAYLRKYR